MLDEMVQADGDVSAQEQAVIGEAERGAASSRSRAGRRTVTVHNARAHGETLECAGGCANREQ